MNIFSDRVSEKEREEIINKLLDNVTPEQLKKELIECGLKVNKQGS